MTFLLLQADPTPAGNLLLPLLVAVPIVGAAVVALVRDATVARSVAAGIALGGLVLGVVLLRQAGYGLGETPAFASTELFALTTGQGNLAFRLSLAADGVSLWLVLLTLVVTLCSVAAVNFGRLSDLGGLGRGIGETGGVEGGRPGAFFGWVLLMCGALVGAFLARDALLFYVFFELTLVPAFFLIGQFGCGAERRTAATKFFVYTFVGSVFMLAAILYAGHRHATFDTAELAARMQADPGPYAAWVAAGLLAGLCVKIPLVPLHTWQPTGYTHAPAAVTAILSGVLAKLGTYGLIRLALPIGLIPAGGASTTLVWVLVVLATIAVIYAALVAWVQTDAKALVAYSSISHLGVCVLALLAFNTMGGQASVLYMVNHGVSTAGVFLILGMIEDRYGTRRLDKLGGLGRGRPWMAGLLVLFAMSSIGLPLTNGFVSEFLSLQSIMLAPHLGLTVTLLAATSLVLGAIYMLHLLARLLFGPVRVPVDTAPDRPDLSGREILALAPLAILVIALGVMPGPVLDSLREPVAGLVRPLPAATVDADPRPSPLATRH